MKTADRRNRILLLYVVVMLGLFAYERFGRAGGAQTVAQLLTSN